MLLFSCGVWEEFTKQILQGQNYSEELLPDIISWSLFISRAVDSRKKSHCKSCLDKCDSLISCTIDVIDKHHNATYRLYKPRNVVNVEYDITLIKIICILLEAKAHVVTGSPAISPDSLDLHALLRVIELSMTLLEHTQYDSPAMPWILRTLDSALGLLAKSKPDEEDITRRDILKKDLKVDGFVLFPFLWSSSKLVCNCMLWLQSPYSRSLRYPIQREIVYCINIIFIFL